METGSVLHQKDTGRPRTEEANVERAVFLCIELTLTVNKPFLSQYMHPPMFVYFYGEYCSILFQTFHWVLCSSTQKILNVQHFKCEKIYVFKFFLTLYGHR